MNQNDNIVFYQTSDGTYHTAATQEQIFETASIQVASTTIDETSHQYQEVFNGNVIEVEPVQQMNIINASEIMQPIHNVVPTDSDKGNMIRFIRVAGMNNKTNGIPLIADHSSETNLHPNPSYVKTLNMNGTITRTVLVPQNTFAATQIDTSESVLSRQYIVAHNDVSTFNSKGNIMNEGSYLVQNGDGNGLTVQLVDRIQPNGKILVQRIRRKKLEVKKGGQANNIKTSSAIKTGNTLSYKMPISTLTHLNIQPVKKILVQPERLDVIGVEQVQNGQLHVVTDVGNSVPANVEGQNVLYETVQPKTKIIFKIMQPEDFKQYTPLPANGKTVKVKKIKPKPPVIQEKTIPLTKFVTRTGRHVQPPKHITSTYNSLDEEDLLNELDEELPSSNKSNGVSMTSLCSAVNNGIDKNGIEPAVKEDAKTAEIIQPSILNKALKCKKRIKCITCKKVYSGIQCMGKHLLSFPEHATTERLKAILDKYKAQKKAKELALKVTKANIPIEIKPHPTVANISSPVAANVINAPMNNSIHDFECKEERNIFVSLVRIIEKTSEECKASVFVRQLSALILKLKRLMPCLLFEDKSSSSCMINESVGKMLDVKPGKYRLNMNAIKCLGEQGGNCPHIPPKVDPPVKNINNSWLKSDRLNMETCPSNTLITSASAKTAGNKEINKWSTTSNSCASQNLTNKELEKWKTDEKCKSLNKWKSPSKSKKKIKTNDMHKWPSTVTSHTNGDMHNNWTPISENICDDNIKINNWKPISNECPSNGEINKWTSITSNGDSNELSEWTTTANSKHPNNEIHKWSSSSSSQNKNDLQWTETAENSLTDKNDCSKWTSTVTNGGRDKVEWPSTITNGCKEYNDLEKWTSTVSAVCQNKDDLNKWPSSRASSQEKDELDKWTSTTNNGKRKWIPIGTRDPDDNSNANDENWLSTNSDVLMDNATFPQTVDTNTKTWDSLQKQSRLEECTPRSPWQANIPELNKMDMSKEIIPPPEHISSASQPIPSDDSLTFDCSTKMVEEIHSNLVFDINKEISLDSDVDLKKKSIEPENFDFNDSRFDDIQIDPDKLNFNEIKYGPDALPPFSKIETPKNLQLPVDSLSDISSDGDKLRLPSTDGILTELGSESLGLTISNEHIEPMDTVETRKNVTLNQSEDAVHCDDQSLLNTSDLNLPINNTDNLSRNESILSVSESSLDGGRLNLSSSLNLLDSLTTDCLSFTDSDLRNTSQMSLDLQDLFPFHHT